MTDFPVFKRMRFFTGFFTTAEDWTDGQDYFREKQKLHNRGLHIPGIIAGLGVVKAEAGDFKVEVQPGAALDGLGNEFHLPTSTTLDVEVPTDLSEPKSVFIAIKYGEVETDYVENVEAPQYKGHTRVAEMPVLKASQEIPDNETWMELARIRLVAGVTKISNAVDSDAPGDNEINLRNVMRAGSVGLTEPGLSTAMVERVIVTMQAKRRAFAALAARFPVPSAGDVRQAALTVEILARIDALPPEQSADVMPAIAAAEQDVWQEIGTAYPGLVGFPQFEAYQDAVTALLAALQGSAGLGDLLTLQEQVAAAARELSEIVLQEPIADTGVEGGATTVVTTGDEATVTLDASDSEAFGEREIVKYIWDKRS
ncbi:MAG: hypothetical protein JXA14_10385 [Anaerolineae bacterium]|nr:hypothetical protein [Anaerolineae bacterium]